MIKTMTSAKQIHFEDCDPFSHLNNANYLTCFPNARKKGFRFQYGGQAEADPFRVGLVQFRSPDYPVDNPVFSVIDSTEVQRKQGVFLRYPSLDIVPSVAGNRQS